MLAAGPRTLCGRLDLAGVEACQEEEGDGPRRDAQ